jgi:hypothetical protein
MGRDRAAYMRDYRARHRAEREPAAPKAERDADLVVALQQIMQLEAEVRHLKAELARRSLSSLPTTHQFNSRPFTPVPKKRD